jgi:hypothetical protein
MSVKILTSENEGRDQKENNSKYKSLILLKQFHPFHYFFMIYLMIPLVAETLAWQMIK